MPSTLASWQGTLESHFSILHSERSKIRGEQRVFALEHGLTESEVSELSTQIRDHIEKTSPSERHWLPWMVYAPELGYRYSGDEYWQTFEESTPGWELRGDRAWLRECFGSFARSTEEHDPLRQHPRRSPAIANLRAGENP